MQSIQNQRKQNFLLASKRLIKQSLNLDNSCVKLRAATFFLTNLEYSQSIEVCDTFLSFPPRHRVEDTLEWKVVIIIMLMANYCGCFNSNPRWKQLTKLRTLWRKSCKCFILPLSWNLFLETTIEHNKIPFGYS